MINFILASSGLDVQMQEFSQKVEEYNYTCRLRNRMHKYGEEPPTDLLKSMEKQKQELLSKNIEIKNTGDRVTQIVKNCIAETLPSSDS